MAEFSQRRSALRAMGLGLAAIGGSALSTRADAASPLGAPVLADGAGTLKALMERLVKAPRRRDFKTVPMILTKEDEWDAEAIREVMAYKPVPKQVWDNTDIASPWLNLMRNSLNAQIWSFKHPDFLAVSLTHGSAHLALYDEATWEKYDLTRLAGDKFRTNTLIAERPTSADPRNYEDPRGLFSPDGNSLSMLMRRGVVFMSCHNAIWEQAGKLIATGTNPDKLSHEQVAAELSNHLLPGVILTPGAVATIPELQQVGFQYIK